MDVTLQGSASTQQGPLRHSCAQASPQATSGRLLPDHIHCQAWVGKDEAIINQILPSSVLGFNPGIRIVDDLAFSVVFQIYHNEIAFV